MNPNEDDITKVLLRVLERGNPMEIVAASGGIAHHLRRLQIQNQRLVAANSHMARQYAVDTEVRRQATALIEQMRQRGAIVNGAPVAHDLFTALQVPLPTPEQPDTLAGLPMWRALIGQRVLLRRPGSGIEEWRVKSVTPKGHIEIEAPWTPARVWFELADLTFLETLGK